MFLDEYIWFLAAMFGCAILSIWASVKVKSTYAKYDRVKNVSGYNGYDTAVKLMRSNEVYDISVGKVKGTLTDHYNPQKAEVNLSEATYRSNSVAAVAVAAHEIGHVMQHKKGYMFYKVRTALVPVVNFGSWLAMPLVIVGLLIDIFLQTANPELGFYVALVGVALYGGSFIFALVTYPVEVNASRRAKKMLVAEGVLTEDEIDGASKVLSAAALTYLASLLTSFIYFMRFFLYVLTIFGRRD